MDIFSDRDGQARADRDHLGDTGIASNGRNCPEVDRQVPAPPASDVGQIFRTWLACPEVIATNAGQDLAGQDLTGQADQYRRLTAAADVYAALVARQQARQERDERNFWIEEDEGIDLTEVLTWEDYGTPLQAFLESEGCDG